MTAVQKPVEALAPWRAAHEESQIAGAAALAPARERAFARFEALGGAPRPRDEYWRYARPAPLLEAQPLREAEQADPFAAFDPVVVEFAEGVPHLPAATAEALDLRLIENAPWALEFYGELEAQGQFRAPRPLAAWNTAVARTGLAVRVAEGQDGGFLHLRHLSAEGTTQGRIAIDLPEGARLTLLESGVLAGGVVIEARIARGAQLHHVRLQTEQPETRAGVAHVFADLGAEAIYKGFTLSSDGRMTRNETYLRLGGEKGWAHVAQGVLGDRRSISDTTLFIHHDAPHCESRQIVKSALAGESHVVFQGKIYVAQIAQKTDGYQMSQALLLGERAEFNAKPELEIYADDVKCSHGSTSGALDADALFYLKARGVPHAEAEALLTAAFIDDAILEIEDEALQDAMRAHVARWMEARGRAGAAD